MRYTSALLTSSAEPICKQQHTPADQSLQKHGWCRPMPAVVVNSAHDSKDTGSIEKVGTLPTRQVKVAAPTEAGTISARWGGGSVKTFSLDTDNAQSTSSRYNRQRMSEEAGVQVRNKSASPDQRGAPSRPGGRRSARAAWPEWPAWSPAPATCPRSSCCLPPMACTASPAHHVPFQELISFYE